MISPEKFFGFRMGADRKIARWDKLVEYDRLLEKEGGGKLAVIDMGPTEMGNPFLLVIITSPANQKSLESLRRNNLKLADPRGVPEAEIRTIAAASGAPSPLYRTRRPPEYRNGLGTDGVAAIKDFVDKGGTLVALGGATDFAISRLGLPARNVVEGLSTKDFFCPGSTLRVAIDNSHPLAYGMPAEGLVVFHYSPAFDILATDFNDRNDIVVRYAERSGWLNGERYLAGKTAMASLGCGRGRVVLIGFRTQNRAQTHGTYKLLFNALSTAKAADLAIRLGNSLSK